MACIKINGVAIATPAEITQSIQEISEANRNANGLMIKEKIADKVKLSLKWNKISNSKMSTVLSLISNNTFSVTYFDVGVNSIVTKTFYAGDRSMEVDRCVNGILTYKNLSFNIIEV